MRLCPRGGRVVGSMLKKTLPDVDFLRELLDYNPGSGLLTWRARSLSMFSAANGRSAENCHAVWNAKHAGKLAGSKRTYIVIKVEGEGYLAHRLAWKMMTGSEPGEIDHRDRNKHNNRWANLRDAGHAVNMRNRPASRLNTSGHKHIHWSAKLGRWVVQLSVPGRGQRQIAWEATLPAAIAARDAAYSRFGYDKRTDAA